MASAWWLRGMAWAGCAIALGACESAVFEFDRFPVGLSDAGFPGVLLGLDDAAPVQAVVDTAAPQTLFALREGEPRRRRGDVTVYASPAGVARARFRDVALATATLGSIGLVTSGSVAQPIGAVLGADLLSQHAVRLDLQARQLFFFPALAGTDELYGRDCAAVLPAPIAGGGTLLVDGDERDFAATRLIVGACAGLYAERVGIRSGGTDLALVIATGVTPLVLARSAYERSGGAPLPDDAPTAELRVPGASGVISVRMGTLSKLTLVGDSNEDMGPCEEAWIALHTAIGGCCRGPGCPCVINNDTCKAPATVELCGSLQVAVVADTEPFLQTLRDELRPRRADIDGLLGTQALSALVADLDYPGGRLIFDCQATRPEGVERCTILPRAHSASELSNVDHCTSPAAACGELETFPATITCPNPDAGPVPDPDPPE